MKSQVKSLKKKTYRTLTSLMILSLLGQPIVGLAPHLVSAETITAQEEVTAENLLLEKPVEYSTHWGTGGRSESAVDGNETTFWRNHSDDENPNLIIDLEVETAVQYFEVLLYIDNNSAPMNSFTLEYSNDKTTWETLTTETEALNGKELFQIPADISARYIRFSHDSELGAKHGAYELRAFDTELIVEEEEVIEIDETNISYDKTVSATTDYAAVRATHVLDNDLTTYWRNTAADEAPAITLDLGTTHQVDEVELVLYVINPDRMQAYTLEHSTDGESWTSVVTETENLVDGETHTITMDAEARYIRFSHASNGSTNGLYELRAFGSEIEEEVEETEDEVDKGTNIALGKTTNHSTQWGGGGRSEWAVDGDADTFWRNLSSDSLTPWMTVDLGENAVFDQVDLQLYLKNADQQMTNFQVEYSNDLINWELLAEETEGLTNRAEFSYDVTEATGEDYIHARYLRFTHELGAIGYTNGVYEIEVYEAEVAVDTVQINRGDFGLLVGNSLDLNAEVLPVIATQDLTWTSSDSSIATVDENGTVTAIGAGEAVISATSFDGVSSEITVSVLEESTTDKEITAFSIDGHTGTIDEENRAITTTVPFSLDLTKVAPTFETNGVSVSLNGQVLTSGETTINLSKPVTLEVSGTDGIMEHYDVQLVVDSNGQDIAYGKEAYTTAEQHRTDNPPEYAVDGNPNTQFKSVIALYNTDITNPPLSWFDIDLGQPHIFDRVEMDLYNHFNILEYKIQVSDDGETWVDVYTDETTLEDSSDGPIGNFDQFESAIFDPVTARYVRFEQRLVPDGADLVGGMNDFAIHNGEANPVISDAVIVVDGETEIPVKGDIEIPLGESVNVSVRTILSNGEPFDIAAENITLSVVEAEGGPYIDLQEDGTITALKHGVSRLTASVTHEGRVREFDFFVDSYDYETVIFDTVMEINDEAAVIGYPSIVNQNATAPTLNILPYFDGTLSVVVEQNGTVLSTNSHDVTGFETANLPLEVGTSQTGTYSVSVTLEREGHAPH